jgi:uncharacterized protein with PIN domain
MSAETRRRTRLGRVDLWLTKIAADIVPVDAELVDLAIQAWLIYGKGRHPAALNFTDCCSYVVGPGIVVNGGGAVDRRTG